MAQDYTEFLAINVLNEQQIISYRSLSRALKVHSNLAKQMLYDFHRKRNAKHPGSVHATYLLSGTKRTPSANGPSQSQDDDYSMHASSPPLPGSSAPETQEEPEEKPPAVHSIVLVKQEQLEKAKATFETITGIHIYSLQATGLSDMMTLTECNRKIAIDYASEDPLLVWKQYGTIQAPNVWRRSKARAPPLPASIAKPAPAAVKAKAPVVPTKGVPTLEKQGSKDSQDSKAAAKPTSAKATPEHEKATIAKGKAMIKRQDSNLFKSFAKGKAKAKKEDSQSSVEASPALTPADDVSMGGFSDDDAEVNNDDDANMDVEMKVPQGKSKRQREADLQAMMDQEDEVMEDAETPANDLEADAIDKVQPEDEPKETVVVEGGRRRGRRRVMKKKTVKDEDGYLVTKEEAAWESFSEDEPVPKKAKVAVVANTAKGPSSGAKKGAKAAGKGGSGGIMSFFAKK